MMSRSSKSTRVGPRPTEPPPPPPDGAAAGAEAGAAARGAAGAGAVGAARCAAAGALAGGAAQAHGDANRKAEVDSTGTNEAINLVIVVPFFCIRLGAASQCFWFNWVKIDFTDPVY